MKTNHRGIRHFIAAAFMVIMFSMQGLASDAYDMLIGEVSSRHSIDPLLIKALIRKESKFDPNAVGRHGEIGLMQLKLGAVQDWANANGLQIPSREELFLPATNIEIGVWYLAQALSSWKEYRQRHVLALCQYNAGRSKTKEWLPSRKNGEVEIKQDGTRTYVSDILDCYSQYKEAGARVRSETASLETALTPADARTKEGEEPIIPSA
ncbi:MAG: hypothetical protein A2X49_12455 [Lentisphaerae bacterium GWF2_52_8]|nr:MAG: hypothetical protein A2X49_12455 [Lentisphaerae bacterium GWF2_52_8]